MFDDLNENNFTLYAIKCYAAPNCIMSEFENDLKRIKYIKRLFRRYKSTKIIKERLILNHIILLSNVFSPESTVKILFYKIDERDYDILKTFLLYLNIMQDTSINIREKVIQFSDIPIDLDVAEILRKI
jgi:hypothetical protein